MGFPEIPNTLEDSNDFESNFGPAELQKLHYYLADNSERMSKDIDSLKQVNAVEAMDFVNAKRLYDRLTHLLARLEPVPDPPKKAAEVVHGRENMSLGLYTEFMKRMEAHDVSHFEKSFRVFYEYGHSKEKRPVFYFIARRVQRDQIDFEELIFFIFTVRSSGIDKASNANF